MEHNQELKNTGPIGQNPKKAPDCRFCEFYWYTRVGWKEIIEIYADGTEKSFKRVQTFKHACRQFKIDVPSDQLPSLFIYRLIGRRCPVVCEPLRKQNAMARNKNSKYIEAEHDVDIII